MKNGLWNHSANLVIEEESVDKWAFTVKETDVASERSIKAVSIPEIMNTYNIDFIDIFKCDIEGSEWNVFDESCEEWINKIGVLIVETHDRFKAGCEDRVLSVMQKHNFSGKKISEDWVFINKQFYEQVEDKYVRL